MYARGYRIQILKPVTPIGKRPGNASCMDAGHQRFAQCPQPPRRCRVHRSRRCLGLTAPGEMASRDAFDVRRRCQINRSPRPLFYSGAEQAGPQAHEPAQQAVACHESRGHEAGVEGVGGDACPIQPPGQFVGEQQVRQLGPCVSSSAGCFIGANRVYSVPVEFPWPAFRACGLSKSNPLTIS